MTVERAVSVFWSIVTKRYADFNGRAARDEFWPFMVISFCIATLLEMIDLLLGLRLLHTIYALAVLLPTLGVSVRRLHDTDRSGWWILLPAGPLFLGYTLFRASTQTLNDVWFVGSHFSPYMALLVRLGLAWLVAYIVLINWFIQAGTSGSNRFGEAR